MMEICPHIYGAFLKKICQWAHSHAEMLDKTAIVPGEPEKALELLD
jgi:hypothetical protein